MLMHIVVVLNRLIQMAVDTLLYRQVFTLQLGF